MSFHVIPYVSILDWVWYDSIVTTNERTNHPTTSTEDTVTDDTPDFATLAPTPMGAMFLSTLWASHNMYCDHFAVVYPDVAPTGRFNAWRDSLPSVTELHLPNQDTDAFTNTHDIASLTLDEALEVARLSEVPSEVVTIHRCAIMLAAYATANMTDLHAMAKRRPTVETSDAATVEALRLQLNNEIKIARQMADSGFFTHQTIDSLLPFRVTPKGRKNYDGPALPSAKKSSPIRANTKKLTVMLDGQPAGSAEADFSTNVKSVLRLTMSELKSIVGDFSSENYGQDFATPTGQMFQIVLKSNADEIVEDDEDEDEDS